ncbi:MAG: hypothetical protein ACYDC1_00940 [Limisphaerales bacterium]
MTPLIATRSTPGLVTEVGCYYFFFFTAFFAALGAAALVAVFATVFFFAGTVLTSIPWLSRPTDMIGPGKLSVSTLGLALHLWCSELKKIATTR